MKNKTIKDNTQIFVICINISVKINCIYHQSLNRLYGINYSRLITLISISALIQIANIHYRYHLMQFIQPTG